MQRADLSVKPGFEVGVGLACHGHLLLLLLLLVPLGCATDEAGSREGPGDGAEPGRECQGPGFHDAEGPLVPFASVAATVVDEGGAPVPELRAQACGVDLCLNGETGPTGYIAIVKDVSLRKPAFKYGDGRTHAKVALLLSGDPIDIELGEQITVAFPSAGTSVPFTPGADVTSSGVTLSLPGDLSAVTPDPFDYDTLELQGFRAAPFPAGALPEAVDASLGLEIVVALTPSGADLCPRATLSVENTPGWAAGAPVEFFLHGVEVEEEWAPYGGWTKVSDGKVSADGARVVTDADGGIPELSLVGIRLAR